MSNEVSIICGHTHYDTVDQFFYHWLFESVAMEDIADYILNHGDIWLCNECKLEFIVRTNHLMTIEEFWNNQLLSIPINETHSDIKKLTLSCSFWRFGIMLLQILNSVSIYKYFARHQILFHRILCILSKICETFNVLKRCQFIPEFVDVYHTLNHRFALILCFGDIDKKFIWWRNLQKNPNFKFNSTNIEHSLQYETDFEQFRADIVVTRKQFRMFMKRGYDDFAECNRCHRNYYQFVYGYNFKQYKEIKKNKIARIRLNKWYKCKGCQMVFYCTKSCQKRDWIHHKSVCFKLRFGLTSK